MNDSGRARAGGNVGLMGTVARAVLEASPMGDDAVLGFIPDSMVDREVSGAMLGRTQVVQDMHQRKAAMAAAAEAFVALPGGYALCTH
jgi:predicted Rossmann-fold nucleotide-binding protein